MVSVLNFGFHIIASNELSHSEYGALAALLRVLLIFTVPATALQVAITREVAARRSNENANIPTIVGPLIGRVFVIGMTATVLVALAAPTVQRFLHLPSLIPALLLAAFVFPTAIGLVPKAALLGEQRFRRVSLALLAGTGVRLILGGLLDHRSGLNGALGATVLGEIVTAFLLITAMQSAVRPIEGVSPLRPKWRDSGVSVFAFTGFWALVSIDTLFARHYLGRQISGSYSAASTAASAALFLPSAIALIAFPLQLSSDLSHISSMCEIFTFLSLLALSSA